MDFMVFQMVVRFVPVVDKFSVSHIWTNGWRDVSMCFSKALTWTAMAAVAVLEGDDASEATPVEEGSGGGVIPEAASSAESRLRIAVSVSCNGSSSFMMMMIER